MRLTTLVGAAVMLSACGLNPLGDAKNAASGYDPDADVTLTWWTGQTTESEDKAERLAAEYHSLHPNVTIKTSAGATLTDDLLTKLSAAFTAGTYPDISYAYGSWAGELADSGRTQDLSDYVLQPSFGWSDFPESARQTATTIDGKVIGVPALVDNLALIYNKSMFDDAQLPYPTDDWSWEDFRAAAKTLSDPANDRYGTAYSVAGTEDTTWHLWPLLWQHGGDILRGKIPSFNSPAGVAALETLRVMAVDDKSMYLDQTDEKYSPLFWSGHIGMIMSGPWELLQIANANLDYGVTRLPGYRGDHQTVSGPDLWVLFNHRDPNRAGASRDFIKWLTSKDVDARFNLALGNLPLRSSEKDTLDFTAYVGEYPGGKAFFDNLANAKKSRPTLAGYSEMSRHVGAAIAKVLQGKADPDVALEQAATESSDAFR
ncbi:ABC transporter substrate-binding protein [Cryptosporangium phraense]|uniref:ABC transporter substrate-binding protein n=1 Tax=Cryptosporangium phraense TaxID=2593070 RepID=A0A545ALH9_9ACTN|nr:ABC transporter substrate-binding protein [Cryptosporangium phraense]TQS42162.1 ABC transporter substrate-binding protein [Cryptosporangium phraense]